MAEPPDGSLREAWARAFLRQGKSDLETFWFLSGTTPSWVPTCHRLQFLQMACEKVAKAYRIRDTAASLEGENGLLTRHVGFQKFFRAFLLSPTVLRSYQGRDEQRRLQSRMVLGLARESRKARAQRRSTHGSGGLSLLTEPGGRTFLKLLRRAVDEFGVVRI